MQSVGQRRADHGEISDGQRRIDGDGGEILPLHPFHGQMRYARQIPTANKARYRRTMQGWQNHGLGFITQNAFGWLPRTHLRHFHHHWKPGIGTVSANDAKQAGGATIA